MKSFFICLNLTEHTVGVNDSRIIGVHLTLKDLWLCSLCFRVQEGICPVGHCVKQNRLPWGRWNVLDAAPQVEILTKPEGLHSCGQ